MTDVYIGPILLAMLGNPVFERDVVSGTSMTVISGVAASGDGDQLRELVGNPHRSVTVGASSGVLEPVWIQTRPSVNGWYLLIDAQLGEPHQEQLLGWVGFRLAALRIPERSLPVVVRSARDRGNDVGLGARPALVQPFWGEDIGGQPWARNPGGTVLTREYDPRTIVDVGSPATTARNLRIHLGAFA